MFFNDRKKIRTIEHNIFTPKVNNGLFVFNSYDVLISITFTISSIVRGIISYSKP